MPHDEKPSSIWKKEISFRRKPGEDAPSGSTAKSSGSVWKKEISLRSKKRADVEAVAELPAEPPVLDPVLDSALEAALAELAVEPVAVEPEPEPTVQPAAPIEHDWLTQPLEVVSEPPAETLPPVSLVPPILPQPEPAHDLDLPLDLELGLDLPAEALPEAPPMVLPDLPVEAPLPEPAAVAVAAVAEPVTAADVKVPFYKKELSFGKREKSPKAERIAVPKSKRAAKQKTATEPGEKAPFYKRELSFKRSPKEWDAGEPVSEPKAKSGKAPKEQKPLRAKAPRPSVSLPSFGSNAKQVVGLKIGGSQIAAARIVNGDSPELVQAVREPLEHGIVVGGELRDPEALALALKEFFARHKLPKRGVRLGIANNRIGVRTFEVVGIQDSKQLANAIRFRAQEVLPIPLEDAVLDFQVLSEGVTEDGQPLRRVLLVVAYRELVDRYVYACRKAGLQIVGIDLEAFALLRAIAAPHDPVPGSERGALVAVAVGHERSTFAVSDGRVCEFTRVLEWGGWALNVAIARALDMSPSEVEPVKRALSFAGAERVPDGFSEDQMQAAREAARRQLQTFARELVSSLQFYQNQPGSLGIGEIALTGGTAHLPGLGVELERLIGVPVRIADPLARLKVSKKVREPEQVGSLAVAIGLGIDD